MFTKSISGKSGLNIMLKMFVLIASFAVTAANAALPIQHWQSATGAKVYFVENHDLPILDVAVNFAAGSSFDSAEKAGLAGMT
jgi:zinc protease